MSLAWISKERLTALFGKTDKLGINIATALHYCIGMLYSQAK